MNDLSSKFDSLQKQVQKFNDYYEANHLKTISVEDLSLKLDSLEKSLDLKANNLDLKKLIPRMHELSEQGDLKEQKFTGMEK